MPTEDSRTTPPSQPAALMRAAQAIVERRRQMATATGTESPGWSIRPPPADPGPQPSLQQAPRAPEQGTQSFQWVEAQPGQLFGSIDTVTVPKADGSGHEVRHLDTGKVIAEGRDATEANAGAQDIARRLGRRRLLSWLLPDESTPPSWAQDPKVLSWYDGVMRQGSAWHPDYRDGEAIDSSAVSQHYRDLQDQFKAAITGPEKSDEAHLPLATAGQQLFSSPPDPTSSRVGPDNGQHGGTSNPDLANGTSPVGAPGLGESFIPIWGSGRASINDFQTGHPFWGTVNGALAASDVLLAKTLAEAVGKGIWKGGSHAWGATRAWYGRTRGLAPKTPVHHWLIPQKAMKSGNFVERIGNQPWNLMPMESQAFHNAVHGVGENPFGPLKGAWYGTPGWAKMFGIDETGKGLSDVLDADQ